MLQTARPLLAVHGLAAAPGPLRTVPGVDTGMEGGGRGIRTRQGPSRRGGE